MRNVNFTTLQDAGTSVTSDYTYQFQPRVDGDFVVDTCEICMHRTCNKFMLMPDR